MWLDLDFTPRDAIERAIARIRDRVILRGGIRPEKLVGVEWWVQARGCRQPLHLHADRDETGWRESKVSEGSEASEVGAARRTSGACGGCGAKR